MKIIVISASIGQGDGPIVLKTVQNMPPIGLPNYKPPGTALGQHRAGSDDTQRFYVTDPRIRHWPNTRCRFDGKYRRFKFCSRLV